MLLQWEWNMHGWLTCRWIHWLLSFISYPVLCVFGRTGRPMDTRTQLDNRPNIVTGRQHHTQLECCLSVTSRCIENPNLSPRVTLIVARCAWCTDMENKQQESLTNWALSCLSRSYLRQDYDVTKYWTLAGVHRLSSSALEISYRYVTVACTTKLARLNTV